MAGGEIGIVGCGSTPKWEDADPDIIDAGASLLPSSKEAVFVTTRLLLLSSAAAMLTQPYSERCR